MNKKYKTFKEMYKNRPNDLPFVYETDAGETCICTPVNNSEIVINDNAHIELIKNMRIKERWFVDWFDFPKKDCKHDLWDYEVLRNKRCPCYE
jgi:hypothetical protein